MQPARNVLLRLAPALIAWSGGTLLAFYPVFFSGFAGVPGDLGDARLTHYLLEHGYRWATFDANHRDLWSPPFFYPAPNVAGYSDLFLSAVPFYGCWRLLGLPPDTSFQLCFMALVSLNFASFYLFLTRCLGLSEWPAAVGAFLFAFASPRLIHVVHLQLHVHFYSVLAIYALYRLLERDGPSRLPGPAWALLFWVGAVGQLYSSFYLGWFLALGLVVCAGWALALPASRAYVLEAVRHHGLAFVGAALLAAPSLWWMGRHYLDAARDSASGLYPYETAGQSLPNPALWFCRGRDCWFSVAGALTALGALSHNPWPLDGELALGIGPITTALALVGLVREWRRPTVRVLLLASLTLAVCFTVFWWPEKDGDPGKSLYRYLFPLLPAAGAIRVPGRIVFLLLVPAAMGLAYFVQRRPRPGVGLAVLVVCLLEQGRSIPTYDKYENRARIAEIVERVPHGARAFYVSRAVRAEGWPDCRTQLDATWAGIETGVPTVNGYSGREPKGWGDLGHNELLPGESTARPEKALDDWLAQHGLTRKDVVWVRLADPP